MGAAIEACSRRQVSTAIDTAGAELFAASIYAAVLLGIVMVVACKQFMYMSRAVIRTLSSQQVPGPSTE